MSKITAFSNHWQPVFFHTVLPVYTEWRQAFSFSLSEAAVHFTARANWLLRVEASAASLLFWAYSYLFPYRVSVCGESPSSLRCSSSTQQQLSEMIITQAASEVPSQLSVGGWLWSVHHRALAGLPRRPKLTYLTGSSTYEINTQNTRRREGVGFAWG